MRTQLFFAMKKIEILTIIFQKSCKFKKKLKNSNFCCLFFFYDCFSARKGIGTTYKIQLCFTCNFSIYLDNGRLCKISHKIGIAKNNIYLQTIHTISSLDGVCLRDVYSLVLIAFELHRSFVDIFFVHLNIEDIFY